MENGVLFISDDIPELPMTFLKLVGHVIDVPEPSDPHSDVHVSRYCVTTFVELLPNVLTATLILVSMAFIAVTLNMGLSATIDASLQSVTFPAKIFAKTQCVIFILLTEVLVELVEAMEDME